MAETEVTQPNIPPAKNIYEALNRVMSRVGYVQKEQKSGGLKFSYASESALIAAIRPEFVKEDIVMYCEKYEEISTREYTSNNGSNMINVVLLGTWRFVHAPSGSSFVAQARGEGSDSSDKATNKAMTGSLKYVLRQTCLVETGDDPDASQDDERKSPSTSTVPTVWRQSYIDALIAKGLFENPYAVNNALKLSHALKPGITALGGLTYWAEMYRKARTDKGLSPEEAADDADSEYNAEKIRKAQDKSGE